MMSGKDITVVIPVRNRPELIVRCLDSVLAQRVRPGRVIVVDNGSTDDTAARVTRWAGEHAAELRTDLQSEPTPGVCAARNRGLGAVDTEWVCFFDSDDTMRPGLFEAALPACKDADIVHWMTIYHSLTGSNVKPFSARERIRKHFFNCLLSTQQYMVRTEFVREAGGWNDLPVWNDWELGIRLLGRSPRMAALPRVLVDIYAQEESITGRKFSDRPGLREATLDSVAQTLSDGEYHGVPLAWKGFSTRRLLGIVDYRRVNLAAIYRSEGRRDLGDALLEKTLRTTAVAPWRRALLRIIYAYTSRGGRAAYKLWH